MTAVYFLICAVGSVAAALSFIALGMRIANENNKKAWEKYYEGQGKKNHQYTGTQYAASVVPFPEQQRKVR